MATSPNAMITSMDKMVLTNAYFMNKWPDTGKSIITNRERPSGAASVSDRGFNTDHSPDIRSPQRAGSPHRHSP